MGFFSSKKSGSPGVDDFYDATGGKKLSRKEMAELTDKMQGKVKRGGDIKAGLDDLRKGRTGSQGRGKLPERPEGKGRSMWGKNTPLK